LTLSANQNNCDATSPVSAGSFVWRFSVPTRKTRRDFLKASSLVASGTTLLPSSPAEGQDRKDPPRSAADGPIKVVVWDERQPAQKQAYANFLGNAIADHLGAQPGISVKSVSLDDPGQGLGAGVSSPTPCAGWEQGGFEVVRF
jgi:hypothetical protein